MLSLTGGLAGILVAAALISALSSLALPFGFTIADLDPRLDGGVVAFTRGARRRILLSLAAGERHGYGIIQDAERRGERMAPDVGTMYRALRRMNEQGLIAAAERRRAPDAADERRNDYRITPLGRQVARAEARRLEALTRAARTDALLEEGAT